MKLNIETTSALRRKLLIELEPDEITRELDRAYNELRRGVVLKGFRRGHAPRNLLERFFGDQVRGDVIQRLLKEYTAKALAENNFKPVVEPEIATEEANLPEALKFSAAFDLKPEIVIKDYQDLRIPEQTVEIKDEDVDAGLERIRQRQAKLKKVEGRTAVCEGDVVLAVIGAFAEGKPLSEDQGQSRLLEVSRRNLAHGIDELLIGAEAGKEISATRSYGADYEHKELAGKTVEWRATVKEIYQRELPALDDEFARDQGDCQSLAELRERVHRDLLEQASAEADARARQGLLDLILERNPFELPDSLVVREQRAMESELGATLRAGGLAEEQVAERLRIDAEDLKTRAEKRARVALMLDALAEQESITVSDDELAERLGIIMRQGAGRGRDRLTEIYSHEENREALRGSMRREKVLDHLLAHAKGTAEGAPAPSQP
jgi:trigger factor